jgi:nucleotide-binding universal stress UspA family protein
MRKTILVPIDGSSSSEHAFRYALRVAKGQRAHIEIWSIVDTEAILGHMSALRGERPRIVAVTATVRALVDKALKRAKRAGVDATGHVVLGRPAERIAARASSISADSIVMGSHGQSGFKRLFMGSVAETILRSAPCPVVIVREKTEVESPKAVLPQLRPAEPVFVLRVLEIAPRHFQRLYRDLVEFWSGPGAGIRGFVEAQLLGSRDNRRLAVLVHFRSYHDWIRAQWSPRLGHMLEEINAAAQTLEFELYHGDRCVAKAPRRPHSRGVLGLGRKPMSV